MRCFMFAGDVGTGLGQRVEEQVEIDGKRWYPSLSSRTTC